MESSPKTRLNASKVIPLGQKYTAFAITAVLPEIDFAITCINGNTQVAQRSTIIAIITKSLIRNLLTACAPPAEVVTSFVVCFFLLIPFTSYSNPSSPSCLATLSDNNTKNKPTRDWNRPTAVAMENLPLLIPFAYM